MSTFAQTGAANRLYVCPLDLKNSVMDLRAILSWVSSSAAPETLTFASAIYSQVGRSLTFSQVIGNTQLAGLPQLQLVNGTAGSATVTTVGSTTESLYQVILARPVRLDGRRNRYFIVFGSPNAHASWAAPGLLAAGGYALAARETLGAGLTFPTQITRAATPAPLGYTPVFQLLSETGATHLL